MSVPGGIAPLNEFQKLSERLARIEALLGGAGTQLTFGTFEVEFPGGSVNSNVTKLTGLPATLREVFLSPGPGSRCGTSYAITSATTFEAATCTANGEVPPAGTKRLLSYLAVSK